MPANLCVPHTAEAKAKMSAARKGKPAPWKRRASRVVEGVLHYQCGRCRDFFPRDGFHANKRTVLGIKSQCKKCHNACSIASQNREVRRLAGQRHEANRRAWKAGSGGKVTAADWRDLLAILGSLCLKCGSNASPTQDHIVPLAKGGAHHPANLQPLCRPCNEQKQARAADYRTPDQVAAVAARWAVSFQRIEP